MVSGSFEALAGEGEVLALSLVDFVIVELDASVCRHHAGLVQVVVTLEESFTPAAHVELRGEVCGERIAVRSGSFG